MFDYFKECQFCQYKDSIENYKDGQRGLVGKSAKRIIMIQCPQCNQEIKWNTLECSTPKPDQKAKSGAIFNLISFIVIALIIVGIIRFID